MPNAEGSALIGRVEHPGPLDLVPRLVVVSGWHAVAGAPVAAVTVEVEGAPLGRARSGPPRDDVASLHGQEGLAGASWEVPLDLRELRGGVATLVVTIYPSADELPVVLEPLVVRLEDPDPEERTDGIAGALDEPVDGGTLDVASGVLRVAGWALGAVSPVARVEVTVDGIALGPARLGVDRADVAVAEASPGAPTCGFELAVDLEMLGTERGETEIRAAVVALDGTCAELVARASLHFTPLLACMELSALPPPAASAGALDLLVVTHDLGYGGAQLWLDDLLRASGAGADYPCTLIALRGGPLADELAARGVEVHVTTPLPSEDHLAYEGRLAELDAWLGERSHSAALINTFRAFPGADLASRRGIPVIWAVHESWPEPLAWAIDHPGEIVDPTVRALAARAMRAACAVVFEAEATRRLYESRAPGTTLVVPYGVDCSALAEHEARLARPGARRALGLDADGPVLLCMGTIEPRKCQATLVSAFAQVAGSHPTATLALVGDLDTAYSRGVRELIVRLGLERRVRVEPVTDDAVAWYVASDALVICSDVESLPRAALEAMAIGIPVAATSVFGLPELLVDGETGILFEPNDLGAAIGALTRLLSLGDEGRAALGARGRDVVRSRHDSSAFAQRMLALLRAIAARPESPVSSLFPSDQSAST